MTITYLDGKTLEAVQLARAGSTLRVAVENADDVLEFTDINGTWVSEDCEPVRIEFAWQRKPRQEAVTEADCICPKDLAAELVRLFLSGDEQELTAMAPPSQSDLRTAEHAIVC
jgi:hypothetical protein